MPVVRGRVETTDEAGGSFAQHRLLITYRRAVDEPAAIDDDQHRQDADDITVGEIADASSAVLASDGTFTLTLPPSEHLREPIEAVIVAPTGQVIERKQLKVRQLEREGALDFKADPALPFIIQPSADLTLGQARRLTGRAIGRDGGPAARGLPIVVWGLTSDRDASIQAIAQMETQVGGYFSGPWPSQQLVAAYAEVAGERASIGLEDGYLPSRMVLVADLPAVADDDCDCAASPPRTPGLADLTNNPEAFSQDLGGGCVSLTMPSRVLEEYSYFTVVRTTEPEVRPMDVDTGREVPPQLLHTLLGMVGGPKITPDPESPQHRSARRDDHTSETKSPNLHLNTTQVKNLLEASQITTDAVDAAEGHAKATKVKGALASVLTKPVRSSLDGDHSIDWDSSPTIYEAASVALGHVLHFRQVWRADGYSLGDLLYSLPLAPGQKRLVSVLDWTRRTSGTRTESLESEEQMRALVERDRDVSEIVHSSLDERVSGGSESSSSAGGGGIGLGFIGAGFGVFAGIAGGGSSSSSSSWQDSSRRIGGDSLQQIRDRTTQRASSVRSTRSTVVQTVSQGESVTAQTEVVANHNHCHAMTIEYFEVLRHFQVSQELVQVSECVFVPMPMRPFDQDKVRRWRAALLAWLRKPALAKGFDAIERIATSWQGWDYPENRFSEEAPEELDGELRISFVIPRPRDDIDGAFQYDDWRWFSPFLPASPMTMFNSMADYVNLRFRDITRRMTTELATQVQRARDEYFAREIAPLIAERIVHALRFAYVTPEGATHQLPLDATLVSKFAEGVGLYVSLRASGDLPALPRENIARFQVRIEPGVFADLGLDVVPQLARIVVKSGKVRYRTPHFSHLLFGEDRIDNDLRDGDDVVIGTPLARAERRDPRADDFKHASALIRHLNEHLEYYHQAIWVSLDPQRRYLLLDGIIAPNSGGRSVASVVENRLIGIVGNSLVLPVTPGIHLDPTIGANEDGQRTDLIHAYVAEPPPPMRISVPTRGVYAEAIMGDCNSCEKKDDTRFWRWEESPLPDQPTAIEPLSTDSRQADDADGTPTPLPPPIINIQAPPSLPDPLGLRQALEILGRSDLFRDASGLEGTQRNALAAFNGVMDTAQLFGGMAAKLAGQQESARTVDRTLDQIKHAQSTGMLSDQQAQSLAHAALNALAGDDTPADQHPVHDPAIAEAINRATDARSGTISVTSPTETVEAAFDDETRDEGSAGVGAALRPRRIDKMTFVTLPLVLDSLSQANSSGTQWAYDKSTVLSLAGDLDTALVHTKRATSGLVQVDFNPAALSEQLYRRTTGNGYQVQLKLNVTYPTNPGSTKVAGQGRLPVVVIAHGRHAQWMDVRISSTSTTRTIITSAGSQSLAVHRAVVSAPVQSYKGYQYLQDELARRGIVSVSVDFRLMDLADMLVESRADLIIKALEFLRTESTTQGSVFKDRLDFDRVGLVGHSRGGDAVVEATRKLNRSTSFKIRATTAVAPTDFTGGGPAASRTFIDSNDAGFFLALYGARDGDVTGFGKPQTPGGSAFRHYDRARCPKAMVFFADATHNGFNTAWVAHAAARPSDPVADTTDPKQLSPAQHQALLTEYATELFDWQLRGRSAPGKLNGTTSNSLGADASLQWMWGTAVRPLDDFENASTNLVGGSRTISLPSPHIARIDDEQHVDNRGITFDGHMPHQTRMLHLEATSSVTQDAMTTTIPSPLGDWSGMDTLLVNVGGWYDPSNPATVPTVPARIQITLRDVAGQSHTINHNDYGTHLPSRPTHVVKPWPSTLPAPPLVPQPSPTATDNTMMRLETLAVPLGLFTSIDLQNVTELSLSLDGTSRDVVLVDSLSVIKR